MMLDGVEYMTGAEMAAHHGLMPSALYRILRADAKLPPDARRIKGAFKMGEGKGGTWLIPRSVALAWRPRGRGRPPEVGDS